VWLSGIFFFSLVSTLSELIYFRTYVHIRWYHWFLRSLDVIKKEQNFPYPELSCESVCFSWTSTVHYTNTFGKTNTFVKRSPSLVFNFLQRLLFALSSWTWSSLFLGGFCVFVHQFLPALSNESIILIHPPIRSESYINYEIQSLTKRPNLNFALNVHSFHW